MCESSSDIAGFVSREIATDSHLIAHRAELRPDIRRCTAPAAGGVGRTAAIIMRAAIVWAAWALAVGALPTAPHGAAASAQNATTHAASAVPADLPLSLTPPLPEEETGSSMRTWPVGGADAALLPEVPLAEGPARLASGQPCALDSQCTSRICRCRNNFRRRAEMCEGVGKVCMELLPVGAECHDHRCTRPLHLPSPAAPNGLRARAGRVCRTSATARRTRGGETTVAPTASASAATGAGATGNATGRSRWRTPPARTAARSMAARCAALSSCASMDHDARSVSNALRVSMYVLVAVCMRPAPRTTVPVVKMMYPACVPWRGYD